MRPREYGGDNSLDNSVPVPREVHQSEFNQLWREVLGVLMGGRGMTQRLYPRVDGDYLEIRSEVERLVDRESRFPAWPFKAPSGQVDICQYALAIESPFGPVLQSLARTNGDRYVSLVVLEPSPESYYFEEYGSYPAFSLAVENLDTYGDVVAHEPDGDPTGAVTFTADVVAIVGDSGKWAVWGERWWDLSLVLTDSADGPWTRQGVDFVNVHDALDWFTEPPYKTPLDPAVREAFLANVRSRGSGPR